ncbi:hypothetical protein [Lonepinella sp. BR2357]|uniref:hypothetical protein n=1 Tax=Lonepinella sp. BR2357 TaxID=3434549 RepID=UPI003F6E0A6E
MKSKKHCQILTINFLKEFRGDSTELVTLIFKKQFLLQNPSQQDMDMAVNDELERYIPSLFKELSVLSIDKNDFTGRIVEKSEQAEKS